MISLIHEWLTVMILAPYIIMPLSNSALFYRFQNLYVDLDLHANARLQGNAAQSIRPNEIIWGCMPRTPPPLKKTSRLWLSC